MLRQTSGKSSRILVDHRGTSPSRSRRDVACPLHSPCRAPGSRAILICEPDNRTKIKIKPLPHPIELLERYPRQPISRSSNDAGRVFEKLRVEALHQHQVLCKPKALITGILLFNTSKASNIVHLLGRQSHRRLKSFSRRRMDSDILDASPKTDTMPIRRKETFPRYPHHLRNISTN